jgi:hypothetical protein
VRNVRTSGFTTNRFFSFVGGLGGSWRVVRIDPISGDSLEGVTNLSTFNHNVDELAGPCGR